MKPLKIFLIVVIFLLLGALGAVGYVWTKIQNITQEAAPTETVESVPAFVESEDTPIANTVPETGIKIDTTAVSEDQKAAAAKVGIDLDSVVITPEMVSCAEQKLGSARVQEIMHGASPTTLESITLLGCL